MSFKDKIIKLLVKQTSLTKQDISNLLTTPPNPKMGDFAFPCFKLSSKKVNPKQAADNLKEQINQKLPSYIKETIVVGPYLNFKLKPSNLAKDILTKIQENKNNYGKSNLGKNKAIVIDFSAPNIAKPFSIGHLRSTIIGNSLYKVYNALGYKSIGVNHLGDWGTQFGKMIVAFDLWGDKTKLKQDPIKYLLSLYVKIHKEAEKNENLNDKARETFKKLEDGSKHETKLWKEFKALSLKEFKRIYKILNIKFDSWNGESFYTNKMDQAIKKLGKKVPLTMSEGAKIIDLEAYKMPPILLIKSNKATTYHTRDLATAYYRLKEYKPVKLLYVVGTPQQLHFNQLFKAMELYDKTNKDKFHHINFGLIKFPEGKISTRKGRVIFLDDVLNKAKDLAIKIINEKNPDLKNKEKVAKQVAIGSVIYADLHHDRIRDVDFDWNRVISFEGDAAPYIQYSHARACSILRKVKYKANKETSKVNWKLLDEQKELIIELSKLTETLEQVIKYNKPHFLANYIFKISQLFNEFYAKCQVISDDKELSKARLLLVDSTRQVLANGLNLLGIKAPKEM